MPDPTRELTTLMSVAGFAGFVLLIVAVAGSGAMFKPGIWYESLAKPDWTPPNWLFPVAWTLLYLMIAIAGWMVWQKVGFSATPGAAQCVSYEDHSQASSYVQGRNHFIRCRIIFQPGDC